MARGTAGFLPPFLILALLPGTQSVWRRLLYFTIDLLDIAYILAITD